MTRPLAFALWFACLACFSVPVRAGAETLTLPVGQAEAFADNAIGAGRPDVAAAVARQLLARNGESYRVLAVLAVAEGMLGHPKPSGQAARRAWRLADTSERRFRAARLVAAALQARGAYTRAEIWLRRALQNASDPRLEAIATRDYEYVRRRNPWTTRLRFGLTPSSNINNGSKSDTMVIGGLPFALSGAAQALSGLEISYGAETRYRHAVGDRVMLHLGGAIEGKSYRLSAGSRAKAPDLDASDLAYQAAELNFGVAWRPAPDAGPIGLELTLGKSFYGGDPLADYARAEMTKRVRLGPRTILRFKAAAEEQWRQDVARNSSTALIGGAALRRKLGNGDRLSVGVGLRDTASDAGTVAHEAKMATIDYRFAKPLAGAELGLSLSYEGRQYDRAVYGASPRSDDRLALGVSVFLPDLDYYGFAPEIGLSAVRNNSNVALYDSEDYGLTVSFKSSF